MKVAERRLAHLVFTLALIAPAFSFAQSSQGTPASVAASDSSRTWETLREKTALSYYGVYYGPSVRRLDSSIPDGFGRETAVKQYFLNYLTTGYKVTRDVTAGVVLLSTYTPVMGHDLTLLDPYLKVTDARMFSAGGFNLMSEMRFFLPVTRATHDAHKTFKWGTFQALSYRVPGTRLTLGTWARLYWNHFDARAKASSEDFEAYLKPQLFYQISDVVTAAVYYEMAANHTHRNSVFGSWSSKYTDLQLGAMLNVMPGVTVNPYLQFATGGKVSTDSTALGAQIFATLL